MSQGTLWGIQTPALLLDLDQFDRNAERLRTFVGGASPEVKLRPHMKTVKSVELGRRLTGALGAEAITVSTLAEAEVYAEAGYRDVLYAVGIAPAKLDRVAALVSLRMLHPELTKALLAETPSPADAPRNPSDTAARPEALLVGEF